MPGVLKLAQLAQHHRMAEMDVGRRRVDPQLDAKRPRLGRGAGELVGQRAGGQRVDRPLGQPGSFVGGRLGGV